MKVDKARIAEFERQLDPQNIAGSSIPAHVVGFGEISVILQLTDMPQIVLKRMPLFPNEDAAADYLSKYTQYCGLLKEAGLELPADDTCIVKKTDRLTVLYFIQEKIDGQYIGNRLIHSLGATGLKTFADRLLSSIYGVWEFNRRQQKYRLALDAQVSNWAWIPHEDRMIYLDTSTPLFCIDGEEQLDPELFLASAPSFGRAIIRRFFLQDVMNRYYDEHLVNIDLVANLYKEKKADAIPFFIEVVNRYTSQPLTEKMVADYYKEDKLIWSLFLKFRKLDRWLHKYVYRKPYQYLLPEKIER